MKNITVKIDDLIHHKARILAAKKGTSLSAMVKEFLEREISKEDSETDRVKALEAVFARADKRAIRQKNPRSEPVIPLSREEIYEERLR